MRIRDVRGIYPVAGAMKFLTPDPFQLFVFPEQPQQQAHIHIYDE